MKVLEGSYKGKKIFLASLEKLDFKKADSLGKEVAAVVGSIT